MTAHTAFTNPTIDAAIEAVSKALDGVQEANPLQGAISLEALNSATATLRELLPNEASNADRFAYDEFSDTRDYEALFEGLSLVAMYVMIDVLHLNDAKTLTSFAHTLQELADDQSAVESYASNWDWEHGVFTHPGDED